MNEPRRVLVKGTQGADVAVVVTVVQGNVWLSIRPVFSWEAIIEPGKVNELMHMLELAREDANKMAEERGGRVAPRTRAITKTVIPELMWNGPE